MLNWVVHLHTVTTSLYTSIGPRNPSVGFGRPDSTYGNESLNLPGIRRCFSHLPHSGRVIPARTSRAKEREGLRSTSGDIPGHGVPWRVLVQESASNWRTRFKDNASKAMRLDSGVPLSLEFGLVQVILFMSLGKA